MNDLILITVLVCVNHADGIIGRSGVYKLLQGKNSKKFMKLGLDHNAEFGALSHISKNEVLDHVDYLIERGCLQIGTLFFPMIQITDSGRVRLQRITQERKQVSMVPEPDKEIELEAICNEVEFWKLFSLDLEKARSSVVIVSAFVSDYRVNMLIPYLEGLTGRGISVKAYIRRTNREIERKAIEKLKNAGVEVVFKKRIHQKIAIIDDLIAWSGSLNMLQHINSHEQMTRHSDPEHVKKLLKVIGV